MRNRKREVSEFYCTCCGNKGIPIVRKPGQTREPGHLKKLYCLYCKTDTNHVEIRPYGKYYYEDFQEEFELGRFFEGKRIPVTQLMFCSKHNCNYNVNGRCWNSNYSFKCGHRKHKTEEELKEMFKNE